MKDMEKNKTPVVLTVFNRPDATARVFERIAQARPPKLLIVADGPRESNLSDIEKCRKVREIVKKVDWPCEVFRNYSDKNLGAKMRIVTGLDWAFSIVEEAIILQDDNLPHPTFFRFCEELLKKYRNNERVAAINGHNLLVGRNKNSYSYYFSLFLQVEGWATWKRFWVNYDVGIKKWPELRDTDWLEKVLGERGIVYDYWKNVFDLMYKEKIQTWDYQLVFAAWIQNSFAAIPRINLVSNIGFGLNKGNNIGRWHKYAGMKTGSMQFPLHHPPVVTEDKKIDKSIAKYAYTFFRPFLIKVFLYFCVKIKRFIFGL